MAVTLLLAGRLGATEYFVAKEGDDRNDGRDRARAFATVQRGIDALQPGDTLTVRPGEYFENVVRTNLGGQAADTLIRSEIPGAAVLRGDVPAPEFRKVEGYRFVYAAPFDRQPLAVLEHHQWRTLLPKGNVAELEFNPGFHHYDTNTRTLYISNPDLTAPDERRYTVAVSGKQGLQLTRPQRVIIEGLAATGFYPGWGINLDEPLSCTVRDCVLFLCVGGLRFGPSDQGGTAGSNNVIERCASFGHTFGGIVRYGANHDVIRNCRTFRSKHEGSEHFGIMHYTYMTGPLLISNNVAWGQNFDYSVKPGHQQETVANNVGLGYIRNANMVHNLIGGGNEYDRDGSRTSADNILFVREPKLDRDFEFADPLNVDFRLQPDSRFRKTGPDGTDRGPYPYAANIYYLAPGGNDQADGLSMRQPWRTLERALKALRPGDTLYLAEGEYAAAVWKGSGNGKVPIRVGGRGRGTVVIRGRWQVDGGAGLTLERLHFPDGVDVTGGRDVNFANCTFGGAPDAVRADKVKGLRVEHSIFANGGLSLRRTEDVFISGNIHAAAGMPAVRMDTADAIRYSDYNSYTAMSPCWEVGRSSWSFADLRGRHDRYSRILVPELALDRGVPRLNNEARFRSLGPHSTALGPHHDYEVREEKLEIVGPFLHSAHDTTANLEWWCSHPAAFSLAWGDTPEMTNATRRLDGPDRFNAFSLTGLQPGRTYYFAIRTAEAVVEDGAQKLPVLRPDQARVSFRTAPSPAVPRTYYVAPDGKDGNGGLSRGEAFRTVNRAAVQVGPGDTVMIAGGAYDETVRLRAAGTPERPIAFRAIAGEKPLFKGELVSLVFQGVAKPDMRFDGLLFGAGFWDKVIVLRQCPRVQVTRCLNVMIGADECPGLLLSNCVVRGGWSGAGLSRSPDSRVENNVFIMTILRHLTCDSSAVVRNNIFCECLRGKAHQTLLELGKNVVESDNCFYVRWPEDEKLAINWRPLTEYRVRTGSNAFAANPMMPGSPGCMQGWQQSKVEDFADCFTANPELVRRGIGLQPAAFRDLRPGVTNWLYDRTWAEAVIAATNAAWAAVRAERHAEALAAYTNIAARFPLGDRVKADIFEQASRCAERMNEPEKAMELAKAMPVDPLRMRRQMELMLQRRQYAQLIAAFNAQSLGGRGFSQSYTYPELEDVMSDLYYYRSLAYVGVTNLAAAEADLRVMNEKKHQLTYRSGEAIHDLAWLRLGDFYRDRLKDEQRAYAAYTNILDRTTWTYWGRPRKPAARGADETLVRATKSVADILRHWGRQAEIPALERNLLLAQAEAAAAMLDTNTMLARFSRLVGEPGETTAAKKAPGRIRALVSEERAKVLTEFVAAADGLQEDTRTLLARVVADGPSDAQRDTALRALLRYVPAERVEDVLGRVEKEAGEKAVRAALEPTLLRVRQLGQAQKWQELVAAFGKTDFGAWSERGWAAEALTWRGQACAALKDGKAAETDLTRALTLEPGNEMALFALAGNYRDNLADERKALDAYLRLHQVAGVGYGWISIAAALEAAALLRKQGRPAEALTILRKFDPGRAAGAWQGKLTEAVKALE